VPLVDSSSAEFFVAVVQKRPINTPSRSKETHKKDEQRGPTKDTRDVGLFPFLQKEAKRALPLFCIEKKSVFLWLALFVSLFCVSLLSELVHS